MSVQIIDGCVSDCCWCYWCGVGALGGLLSDLCSLLDYFLFGVAAFGAPLLSTMRSWQLVHLGPPELQARSCISMCFRNLADQLLLCICINLNYRHLNYSPRSVVRARERLRNTRKRNYAPAFRLRVIQLANFKVRKISKGSIASFNVCSEPSSVSPSTTSCTLPLTRVYPSRSHPVTISPKPEFAQLHPNSFPRSVTNSHSFDRSRSQAFTLSISRSLALSRSHRFTLP